MALHCPKCRAPFGRVEHLAFHLHRCTACAGLWFEMQDHEHLKASAEALDTGDETVGARYNKVDRIDCPRCAGEVPLLRMVDAKQPHIWFESCKYCYGRFYDAGEFRDYAEHTLREFFADLSVPERA